VNRQPTLTGDSIEVRPLREGDFDELFAAAADPLLWEQHPSEPKAGSRGGSRASRLPGARYLTLTATDAFAVEPPARATTFAT
jgi:hypothetical protein